MITPLKRAVIYTRISTTGQEKGTSLPVQFAACQEKAAEIGATVVNSFEDVHTGADYSEREGLQSALDFLDSRQAEILIIANLERYSRDREHQESIKKRVRAAGARLVFCNMDFSDTPEGDLQFGILGSFAQYERLKIRERMVSGKRARARQGIQPASSFPPYGYHIVTKDDIIEGLYPKEARGKYIVIEQQAVLVREIFERYATGQTLREVCRWLTLESGQPSPRNGREWCESTVKRMLSNPVYKGEATFGKRVRIIDERRVERGLSKHTYRKALPEEIITIETPPLVSPELWQQVQNKFEENRHLFSGHSTRKWMLSGLMRCPECGGAMGGRYAGRRLAGETKPKSDKSFVYRCRNASLPLDKTKRCTAPYVRARPVEAVVTKEVIKYAAHPKRLADYWEAQHRKFQKKTGPREELTELKKKYAALKKREETIVEAQIRALEIGATSSVYETKLRDLGEEQKKLWQRIEAASVIENEQGIAGILAKSDVIATLLADVKTVLTAADEEVPPRAKRDILARVIESIIPRDREGKIVDIIFRDPFKPYAPVGSSSSLANIQMLPEADTAPMLPQAPTEE